LSVQETRLKRDLKARFLGLAAVEKLRAKQQSRLNYIRSTEASTRLFYMQANGRRWKNFIRQLSTANGVMHTHVHKETSIHEHFNSHLGQ
ncbi:hypothetical protein BAE44_0021144, partial [Dichanthelium oligosanthes]